MVLCDVDFKPEERALWRDAIRYHILTVMQQLLHWSSPRAASSTDVPGLVEARDRVRHARFGPNTFPDADLAQAISVLWSKDMALREAYEQRDTFADAEPWRIDGFDYWMNRLSEVVAATYVPTRDDLLREVAPRTSHPVIDVDVQWRGTRIRFTDVGGLISK